MSRHGGSRSGKQIPAFQIEVADYSKRQNGHYATSWVTGATKGGKTIEVLPFVPHKTFIKRFEDSEAAMSWASRIGTVLSCRKVDTSPYLKNIEYLNLNKPVSIVLDREEYVIGKALELSHPRIDYENKIIDIEVVDNSGDV